MFQKYFVEEVCLKKLHYLYSLSREQILHYLTDERKTEADQKYYLVRRYIKEHIKSKGKVDFLYCVAKYPTMPEDVNFDKIDFKDKYSGFSDHTIGMNAPLIAVARGAKILEKHFTLSKKMHGPDHQGSMEPNELRQLVKSAREFEEFMSK